MFSKAIHLIFVLSAMVLTACGGKTDTTVSVTGVEVAPQQVNLLLDQTVQLTAAVTPENATDAKVEWVSDNPIVAAVSQDGLVTAVSLGQTTVSAVAGGMRGSCIVTVSPKQVETVTVTPSSLTLTVGDTHTLQASVLPEDATDRSLVWASSDTQIATVDQQGVVTSLAAGNVTISASSVNGEKGECALICKSPFSFSVEYCDQTDAAWKAIPAVIAGYPGYEVSLRLNVVEGEGKTFTWTVDDETHAGYADGKLTLKSVGEASVTVEASDGQNQTFRVESRLSDGCLWGGERFGAGAIIPIGNATEQLICVTWNDGKTEVSLPTEAYTIYSDSELVEITTAAGGYKVRSLGIQGDADLKLKVGEYYDDQLCTVRVSGNWSSGNENLDDAEKFPW